MNGGKLRSQPDGALLQHLLGQVGVLHIHEIPGVKPADFLEHIGAHGHKAAGAELDAAGHGQILILHRVVVVGFLKAAAELRGQLPRQQQPGRRLAAGQVLQLAVRVAQLRRCHGGPGSGQQPRGHVLQHVAGQQDVRVQNKVYVAGQTIQHIVVALAEADIFFQRQHSHAAVAEIRLCQLPAAAVGTAVVHDIQGKIRGRGIVQDAAHRGADLVIITVRHNAGADFGHSKLLETKFYYRGTCRGGCKHPSLQMGYYFSNASRRLRSYGVS